VALLVSHLVGDYLLQTDWQAREKPGGLTGPPAATRALLAHALTYTLAFVPALVWAAPGAGIAVAAAVLIGLPHAVVDDGRPVTWWVRHIKRARDVPAGVRTGVDQSLHVVCLWAVALLVA
jgi:hypothetical protein